jgi:hypothetical protein
MTIPTNTSEALAILMVLLASAPFWAAVLALISHLKNQQARDLLTALVQAAEQVFGPGTGRQKLDYVTQQAAAHGLNVTFAQIEGAVYQLNQAQPLADADLISLSTTALAAPDPAPAPAAVAKPKKATS